MLFFGILVFPVSKFSFTIKAMSILFLARTKDNELFEKAELLNKKNKHKYKTMKAKVPKEFYDTPLTQEAAIHRPIKLNSNLNFLLFLYTRFKCICCCF
jgi:hypothetical protein